MSIILLFENKDVIPWKKALEEKLPFATIEVYPNIKDKETVDFVICWKPQTDVFKHFPNIKVIQSIGASIDHITNSQTLHKDQILTRIVDKKLSEDMWEFLLTLVLSELKTKRTYIAQQRDKVWRQHPYTSITNTTVSILGLGQIGSHVARKFADIGFKVKGWSNSTKHIPKIKSYSGKNEFHAFLKSSDFLINLLPLTTETEGILNKNTFQKLPKSAFIINVGRGEHLIEEDLIEQLSTSMLSGAFLDVFREEPSPEEPPFWNHPKIEITSHVASLTNVQTATGQIVENYSRFLKNEELLNTVSLNKGY